MSLRIAVVYEAIADFEIATELADRVLIDSIDWLDEDLIGDQRQWCNESNAGQRLTWTNVSKMAREAGIRATGHFDGGEPGLPDAKAALRAIRFLAKESPELDAIMLVRDQDDQTNRRDGLYQARRQHADGPPIVIGVATVERECWVISGFDPVDELETKYLEVERKVLGFDPRVESHDLTACKDNQAKRSPKRVLRQLCQGDPSRERQCWIETALATLRDRGAKNGLCNFLEEIRMEIAPLIGHPS